MTKKITFKGNCPLLITTKDNIDPDDIYSIEDVYMSKKIMK